MKRLTITATLISPIITQGYFTFDSILAGILFDKRGDYDVEAAHSAVPIVCTEGSP